MKQVANSEREEARRDNARSAALRLRERFRVPQSSCASQPEARRPASSIDIAKIDPMDNSQHLDVVALLLSDSDEEIAQYQEVAKKRNRAKSLEDKMWGGFSSYARNELEALKQSGGRGRLIADACWALACWHSAHGDFAAGWESARSAREANVGKYRLEYSLTEAFCLVCLGRAVEAVNLLEGLPDEFQHDINVVLAKANCYAKISSGFQVDTNGRQIEIINELLISRKLAPICLKDATFSLSIRNIVAPCEKIDEHPLVSIILPVYNGGDTLEFTLESLVSQSWINLEIIIVDDCSTDSTSEVCSAFASQDPRVSYVKAPRNQGSYSCRNMGLDLARGDFITIHDANDWSHPQKIEIQVRHLLCNPSLLGNHTKWARVSEDLMFLGKFRRKDKLIDWNPSSFFLRRECALRLGGWDRVRVSADAEFVRRAQKFYPDRMIECAFPDAPLAFGLDVLDSLTKTGRTHGKTIYHGVRRTYHELASHWHQEVPAHRLTLDLESSTRPFPVPSVLLPNKRVSDNYSLVYVDDFTNKKRLPEIEGRLNLLSKLTRSLAILQWYNYEADVTLSLPPTILRMVSDGKISIVSPGDEVVSEKLVFGRVKILNRLIDNIPSFTCDEVYIVNSRHQLESEGEEGVSNCALKFSPMFKKTDFDVLCALLVKANGSVVDASVMEDIFIMGQVTKGIEYGGARMNAPLEDGAFVGDLREIYRQATDQFKISRFVSAHRLFKAMEQSEAGALTGGWGRAECMIGLGKLKGAVKLFGTLSERYPTVAELLARSAVLVNRRARALPELPPLLYPQLENKLGSTPVGQDISARENSLPLGTVSVSKTRTFADAYEGAVSEFNRASFQNAFDRFTEALAIKATSTYSIIGQLESLLAMDRQAEATSIAFTLLRNYPEQRMARKRATYVLQMSAMGASVSAEQPPELRHGKRANEKSGSTPNVEVQMEGDSVKGNGKKEKPPHGESSSSFFKHQMASGIKALEEKDFSSALQMFQVASSVRPESVYAKWAAAEAQIALGNLMDGRRTISELAKSRPTMKELARRLERLDNSSEPKAEVPTGKFVSEIRMFAV